MNKKSKDNEEIQFIEPVIVSASRATDIPAFYADWFFNRLEIGYCAWKNPFNSKISYISFKKTKAIVFWSKNPKPLIKYLDILKSKNIDFYIHFTLNDYEKENFEINVPTLQKRIDTFKLLSEKIGKEKVLWRFDPLILTDNLSVETLLERVAKIGDEIKGFAKKLIFSYADIENYPKVKKNLSDNRISYKHFSQKDMLQFAEGLYNLNKKWQYQLSTCAENISLEQFNIKHNSCIDANLMKEVFPNNKPLMDFLKTPKKDKGQRKLCLCAPSKDIGAYNTCPHLCQYCYANSSKEAVLKNRSIYNEDEHKEIII
jgi:DNA repair photolyase